MKKLIGTVLIGILLFTLYGCGQKGPLRRPQQVNTLPPAIQPINDYS